MRVILNPAAFTMYFKSSSFFSFPPEKKPFDADK